jgi:hypothetical protein
MSNLPINSPIKGPGLTKPGVIILQFAVIFISQAIEISFRSSLGIITALSIWIAFFGAIYLGRMGTLYVAAVSPPISLLLSSLILMPTIGQGSFSPTKLLLDLVSGLAAISFYLLSGAAITWYLWFKKERNSPTTFTY